MSHNKNFRCAYFSMHFRIKFLLFNDFPLYCHTPIPNADFSMILPRLGNTVCGMQCTLIGKFVAVYYYQHHDFLLVILA